LRILQKLSPVSAGTAGQWAKGLMSQRRNWRQDTSIPLRDEANNQQMKSDREYARYHAVKQNHKELRKLTLLDAAMVSY
jgi:hypothetical protein